MYSQRHNIIVGLHEPTDAESTWDLDAADEIVQQLKDKAKVIDEEEPETDE